MTSPAQLDALQISPELIRRIALGFDAPVDIAAEFGIDEPTFRVLEQQDWFYNRVLTAVEELKATGGTRIERMKHMYDMVLEKTATEAMLEATSFNQRMAFLDHVADKADIKPKNNVQIGGGSGASIIINIGEKAVLKPAGPEQHTIEMTPTNKRLASPVTLKFTSTDNAELGAGVTYDDG